MAGLSYKEAAEFIRNTVRMKTFPVAVKFLKDADEFPEKTRRPSQMLGRRVAICQAVSIARIYGWTVGLTKEDLICVPAAVAFGFSGADEHAPALARILGMAQYSQTEEAGRKEIESICCLEKGEIEALVMAPLHRASFEADTIVFYGNPAQIMRFIQAWSYLEGERVGGNFGGKVECTEYLIAPYKEQVPKVGIPGMGDRIFSVTQDDELVFSIPNRCLDDLVKGLKEAGSKVGAQYPVPSYLFFEPQFPKFFIEIGKELDIL